MSLDPCTAGSKASQAGGVDAVTAPDSVLCTMVGLPQPKLEAVMSEISIIGLDLAKTTFQLHVS